MTLKQKLESAIAQWDHRNKNHHAGAIALLRLDEVLEEHTAGRPLEQALRDGFEGRLLDRLLVAAGILPNAPAGVASDY